MKISIKKLKLEKNREIFKPLVKSFMYKEKKRKDQEFNERNRI